MSRRHSDTVATIIVGLSLGCLTLAGCSSSPAATGTNNSSTTTNPSSAEPDPSATDEPTSAPETSETPAPADDSAPIGPDGIGQLLLGMSFQEAKDAGFVRGRELPDCASYDMYLGGERYGLVYISGDRGVEAIGPEKPVHTPEDVTIGTTADRVGKVYPDFEADLLSQLGHVGVKVPGHPDATYRLEFNDSKAVTGISLQRTDQRCYE